MQFWAWFRAVVVALQFRPAWYAGRALGTVVVAFKTLCAGCIWRRFAAIVVRAALTFAADLLAVGVAFCFGSEAFQEIKCAHLIAGCKREAEGAKAEQFVHRENSIRFLKRRHSSCALRLKFMNVVNG
jgi:hypothetical protein